MNFCATQQFSYILEVAARFCEFVRDFTRQIPASNALAKVSKSGSTKATVTAKGTTSPAADELAAAPTSSRHALAIFTAGLDYLDKA